MWANFLCLLTGPQAGPGWLSSEELLVLTAQSARHSGKMGPCACAQATTSEKTSL